MTSHLALEDANDNYKEDCAVEIATRAAKLVASRDMGRTEAIQAATEEMRQENAANNDPTGVLETMIDVTKPSKEISQAQINAVKAELMDAARDAAETL